MDYSDPAFMILSLSLFWFIAFSGGYCVARRPGGVRRGRLFFLLRGVKTRDTIASEESWAAAHQGIDTVFLKCASIFLIISLASLLSVLSLMPLSWALGVLVVGASVAMIIALRFRQQAIKRARDVNSK